ncbi:hypothetical protein Tco_0125930, partial [Tanacetum coccineum]
MEQLPGTMREVMEQVEVAEQVRVEDLVGGVEDLVGGVEEEEQQLAHDEEIFREFMEEEARKEEEYARRCREEEEWEAQMDWTRPMHWTEDGNEGNKEGLRRIVAYLNG